MPAPSEIANAITAIENHIASLDSDPPEYLLRQLAYLKMAAGEVGGGQSLSGTVTVKPDTLANQDNPLKVDGSGATWPITASSLPLPTNTASRLDVQAVRDRLPPNLSNGGLVIDSGTKVNASVMPTGGVGLLGWLSGLHSLLSTIYLEVLNVSNRVQRFAGPFTLTALSPTNTISLATTVASWSRLTYQLTISSNPISNALVVVEGSVDGLAWGTVDTINISSAGTFLYAYNNIALNQIRLRLVQGNVNIAAKLLVAAS
jgi:hypothetical protein